MSLTTPNVLPAELSAPPARRPRQLTFAAAYASLGWLLFLGTLLGIYLEARRADDAFYDGITIPLTQPNVMLFTLVLAGLMVQWAVWAIVRDARQQAYLGLGLTALLGGAFVNQTWYLYDAVGLGIGRDTAAPYFYAVTVSHLLMVVAATFATLLVFLRVLAGSFGPRRSDGPIALALFWHATIVAFGIVWLAVYIHK